MATAKAEADGANAAAGGEQSLLGRALLIHPFLKTVGAAGDAATQRAERTKAEATGTVCRHHNHAGQIDESSY